jgi:hypothetical protein
MSNLQILLILAVIYFLFMREREGFVSMHDQRENALYRDM